MATERTPMTEYRCQSCDHMAKDHLGYVGPCAQCWRDLHKICDAFEPRDADMAEVQRRLSDHPVGVKLLHLLDELGPMERPDGK